MHTYDFFIGKRLSRSQSSHILPGVCKQRHRRRSLSLTDSTEASLFTQQTSHLLHPKRIQSSVSSWRISQEIADLTYNLLPETRLLQGQSPEKATTKQMWDLGYIPNLRFSKIYISEHVNLCIKALSCLLEKELYKPIKGHEERIKAIKTTIVFVSAHQLLNTEHKKLLTDLLETSIKIENKAFQLTQPAINAGLIESHHDELFLKIIDAMFHQVGRHALEDEQECILRLLSGIEFVLLHHKEGIFSLPPNSGRDVTLRLDVDDQQPTNMRRLKDIFFTRDSEIKKRKIENAIHNLLKINKLVGGEGEFGYSNFCINISDPDTYSTVKLQALLDESLIKYRFEYQKHEIKKLLNKFNLAGRYLLTDKKVSETTSLNANFLLEVDPCNRDIRVHFIGTPDIRREKTKRFLEQYYCQVEWVKNHPNKRVAMDIIRRAGISLLQKMHLFHVFPEANGRTAICVDRLQRLHFQLSLTMPTRVGDFARYTVEELDRRERFGTQTPVFYDIIQVYITLQETEMVSYLLERQRSILPSPLKFSEYLVLSCQVGSIQLCALLIKYGADINTITSVSQAMVSTTPLITAVLHDHYPLVQYLIEHGANINQQDSEGKTPFDHAIASGYEDIATLLMIKNGISFVPYATPYND
ncbi:ankyrin repeat domain-containing protein [Kistimonas asteriae]|uniref:ankyrin repeat domain-containing protein n=1 Tax=Kistimonas asteriae TaxID=517724 RepID=UPI001BADC88C|nr:ankyrin repeat domain-containing protein [Kistimonas asteriae]